MIILSWSKISICLSFHCNKILDLGDFGPALLYLTGLLFWGKLEVGVLSMFTIIYNALCYVLKWKHIITTITIALTIVTITILITCLPLDPHLAKLFGSKKSNGVNLFQNSVKATAAEISASFFMPL